MRKKNNIYSENTENIEPDKLQKAPLLPMNMHQAKRFTKFLMGVSRVISPLFPSLSMNLKKSLFYATAEEYVAIALFIAGISACFGIIFGFFYIIILYESLIFALSGSILVGLIFFIFALMVYISIPGVIAKKRGKDIDRDLAFALKDLLMQTKSGVNLFTAMRNIAESDYGLLSEEFDRTLNEIESGTSSEEALTELALRCDSEFLGRTIWQLINAMKAGATLETTLSSVVDDISEFQKDQINAYGKTLSVFAMIYLVFALVFPSIGVSFGILFMSVMGLQAYSKLVFGAALVAYIIFVGSILTMVKSQKPMVF